MSKDYTIPELIAEIEDYLVEEYTLQLVEALVELEQYRQSDWVPVTERLPEAGAHVIVSLQYPPGHPRFPGEGFTVIANYDYICNDWQPHDYLHDHITIDTSLVTAWRYQPQPYVRTVEVEATA